MPSLWKKPTTRTIKHMINVKCYFTFETSLRVDSKKFFIITLWRIEGRTACFYSYTTLIVTERSCMWILHVGPEMSHLCKMFILLNFYATSLYGSSILKQYPYRMVRIQCTVKLHQVVPRTAVETDLPPGTAVTVKYILVCYVR